MWIKGKHGTGLGFKEIANSSSLQGTMNVAFSKGTWGIRNGV
jgi:Na+/glutamate symporter